MSFLKNHFVTILFALGGVLFLVPPLKELTKGEPLNATYPVLAGACLVMSIVVGRKYGGGSTLK